MEWDAPAVILDTRPFGERDGIATVLTQAHGAYRGLARGCYARTQASTWQVGNLVQARWTARIADQLGNLTAELVHSAAALAMDDALTLAMLRSICATAEGCLIEREPHPHVFNGLMRLIAHLSQAGEALVDLVRWETGLLSDLGYGLDLTACAVTGAVDGLAFVSPRTGRAVSLAGAGRWQDRLLPLPGFLIGRDEPVCMRHIDDGLRLTGHFLARDVFGHLHRPLPPARLALYHRVCDLAAAESHNV